jgi:hypothetical protein
MPPVRSATVVIGAVVAVMGGAGSARTGAFMAIASGECGTVRDFGWYENPFGTRLVFIGNVGFMVLVSLIIGGGGLFRERYFLPEDERSVTWGELAVRYKVIEMHFMMWCFFLSPMIASFVKYHTEVYDVSSILLGGIYILCSLLLLVAGSTDAFKMPKRDDAGWSCAASCWDSDVRGTSFLQSWTEERVVWFGNELIVPIFAGYSSKKALFGDVMVTLAISASTVIEDCMYLASITLFVNVGYCICVLKWQLIQPRCIGYSNISFAVGQSIGIILAICGSYGIAGVVIVYLCSMVGFALMLMPVIHFFQEYSKEKRGEDRNEEPLLQINWNEIQEGYERSMTSNGSHSLPLIEIL